MTSKITFVFASPACDSSTFRSPYSVNARLVPAPGMDEFRACANVTPSSTSIIPRANNNDAMCFRRVITNPFSLRFSAYICVLCVKGLSQRGGRRDTQRSAEKSIKKKHGLRPKSQPAPGLNQRFKFLEVVAQCKLHDSRISLNAGEVIERRAWTSELRVESIRDVSITL